MINVFMIFEGSAESAAEFTQQLRGIKDLIEEIAVAGDENEGFSGGNRMHTKLLSSFSDSTGLRPKQIL
jgi:hypothetical protein